MQEIERGLVGNAKEGWMGYQLYERSVPESGGRARTVYFFARIPPASGRPARVPEGYEVVRRSDGPVLRRKRW